MTSAIQLSNGSAATMRTSVFLATNESFGYLVIDAAAVVGISYDAPAVADCESDFDAPLTRRQRLATNPERRASLERARRQISKAVEDSGRFSLAKLRLEAGMSQADLARAMGTHQPVIARLEKGTADPQLSTLVKLAESLDVPLQRVIDAIENVKRSTI